MLSSVSNYEQNVGVRVYINTKQILTSQINETG